jgi:biopolymer transport protein ExbB
MKESLSDILMRKDSLMTRGYCWASALVAIISLMQSPSAFAQTPEKPRLEVKSAQPSVPSPTPAPAPTPIPDQTKKQSSAPLAPPVAVNQPTSTAVPVPASVPTPSPTAGIPAIPSPVTGVFLDRAKITEILKVENPLIWPMILCSIVALGYFLDRWFSLRRSRIVPRDFVNRFLDRLGSGKLDRDRAFDLCKANDTPASRVFSQVLMMWGEPAGQIRSAISQAVGMEYMLLRKNIRVLNATATLAPLIGLLGTVVGIIDSFNALGAKNVPSKSAALAEGIGLALVMTALGLVVAIGSVTAYYYLLGKLDSMMVSLEQESLRVMELVASHSNRPGGDRRAGHLEMPRGIDSRIA